MKRALTAVMAAVFLLFLASCSASDGLAGSWRTKFYSEEAQGNVELIYRFRENGDLLIGTEGEGGFSLPFGTYETDGETLVIRTDSGAEKYTYEIKGSTLTLRQNGRETDFERITEE